MYANRKFHSIYIRWLRMLLLLGLFLVPNMVMAQNRVVVIPLSGDDILGSLQCLAGEIAKYDGSKWICSAFDSPCPPDMAQVGPICVDIYEASVWDTGNSTQYGVTENDYPCEDNGSDCNQITARSLVSVFPSRYISWFQAQQACANAGKRLLTNAEWQMSVAGTPEPEDVPLVAMGCNVSDDLSNVVAHTGDSFFCKSRWGIYDLVGNAAEWVADWQHASDTVIPPSRTNCATWGVFSNDLMCMTLPDGAVTLAPMALVRGHSWRPTGTNPMTSGGTLSLDLARPDVNSERFGFRCAK